MSKEMSDIVERLRSCRSRDFWPLEADRLCAEAADEIERLRAELALYKQNYARKQLTDSERRALERKA